MSTNTSPPPTTTTTTYNNTSTSPIPTPTTTTTTMNPHLRFVRPPLPKNTSIAGDDEENYALIAPENLFGSATEQNAALIQHGFEQTIMSRMEREKHEIRVNVWLDPLSSFRDGVESIVKDSFTECFRPREPDHWNFGYILFVMWSLGVVFRYCVLFPVRILLLLLGSVVFALGSLVLSLVLPLVVNAPTPVASALRKRSLSRMAMEEKSQFETEKKHEKLGKNDEKSEKLDENEKNESKEDDDDDETKKLHAYYYKKWLGFSSQWWTFVLAIVIKTHGMPPVKRPNQICVANHTSLIDFIVLKSIVDLASVGQKHTGFVGFMQDRMVSGIWFERFETKQRTGAADLITNWIEDPKNDRLLIFPEGVCVNNEYCVMFKKRVFEIENVEICPIAIKYNKSWSDPYWSSKDESFIGHIMRLMRSWCTVCDVYFLEPEKMKPSENGVGFSSRVKANIARRAGLKNLEFDGYLKYYVASEKLGEKRKKMWAEELLKQFPEVANQPQQQQQQQQKQRQQEASEPVPAPSPSTESVESKKDQ